MWLLLAGCLERVTGIAVPLDPRFYEDMNKVEAGMAMSHGDGAQPRPFADHDGDKVTVSGTITAEDSLPVDMDVRVPDPSAEGGVRGMGKITISGPGTFELEVPEDLGELAIQAFQDPDADGPGGDDAFGEVKLTIGDEDVTDVQISLVAGARGAAPSHTAAPPGAGSEQAPPHSGGGHQAADPFAAYEGDRVRVTGTLVYDGDETIDLDLFSPDSSAPGGRLFLGKLKRRAGAFELQVPVVLGGLEIEAMVDADADGPSPGDPRCTYSGNPIGLDQGDVAGVEMILVVSGAVPGTVAPEQAQEAPPMSVDEAFTRTREAAGTENEDGSEWDAN